MTLAKFMHAAILIIMLLFYFMLFCLLEMRMVTVAWVTNQIKIYIQKQKHL